MGQTKSNFIVKVERRAARRLKFQQHDAHVRARFDILAALELERVRQVLVRPAAPMASEPLVIADTRWIQDPAISDAEYFHQRQTKSGPYVGKVSVSTNMVEYIGGLARLKGASEMQIMAAAKYRMAFDRAQIGGARAVDYAAVKVDTSGPREDALGARQVDALEAYKNAVRCLGMLRSSYVERVIVHDQPLTRRGMGARARDRAKTELLAALDDLAVHFRLTMKRAA
jgi:hypothetical protein